MPHPIPKLTLAASFQRLGSMAENKFGEYFLHCGSTDMEPADIRQHFDDDELDAFILNWEDPYFRHRIRLIDFLYFHAGCRTVRTLDLRNDQFLATFCYGWTPPMRFLYAQIYADHYSPEEMRGVWGRHQQNDIPTAPPVVTVTHRGFLHVGKCRALKDVKKTLQRRIGALLDGLQAFYTPCRICRPLPLKDGPEFQYHMDNGYHAN